VIDDKERREAVMSAMHQPVDPNSGDYRGVFGHYKLRSGIRLGATERITWDRLFRKLWPNANEYEREQLCDRMMKTLSTPDGNVRIMSKTEVHSRMQQLLLGIEKLPPDSHNILMGEG
jgi:hypothetical protein